VIIAKGIGIVLIAAGVLGLISDGFTDASNVHRANLALIATRLKEKEPVYVPIIASAAAIAFGVLLLGFKHD